MRLPRFTIRMLMGIIAGAASWTWLDAASARLHGQPADAGLPAVATFKGAVLVLIAVFFYRYFHEPESTDK